MVSRSSLTLIGLPWNPSKPAAMIFWRSWAMAEAVTAMTGIVAVAGSSRICRNAVIPVMPGSWTRKIAIQNSGL